MNYLRMYLKGCRYLGLNSFDSIDIDLTNRLHIIVGCIGSGKSSILRELAYIVADSADYHKNGVKIIELSKDDAIYTISSNFASSKPHSFMKDGVELNPSGKITVQKELRSQELGLDEDIIQMMLGKIKLTELGPLKRKEWLTKMSDVDMTYALGMHKKVVKETRDLKGALAFIGGRISDTAVKLNELMTDELEDIDRYVREMEIVNDEIMRSDHPRGDVKAAQAKLKETTHRIGILANTHQVLDKKILGLWSYGQGKTKEELDQEHAEIDARLHAIAALSNRTSEEEEAIQRRDASLDPNDSEDFLTASLEDAKAEIALYGSRRRYSIPPKDCVAVNWDQALSEVLSAIEALPADPENKISRVYLKEVETEMDTVRNQLHVLGEKLGSSRFRVRQIDSAEATTCPACRHVWKIGFEPREKERHLEAISTLEKEHSELTQRKEYLEKEHARIREYIQALSALMELRTRYPIQAFFDEITEGGKIRHGHDELYNLARQWCSDGVDGLRIYKAEERSDIATKKLSILKMRNGDEKAKLQELKEQQTKWSIEYNALQARADKIAELSEALSQEQNMIEKIMQEFKTLEENAKEAIESLRVWYLRGVVHHHNSIISKSDAKVKELTRYKAIMDELEKSREEAEAAYEAHTDLSMLLSPTSGIIARSIGGFLNFVTEQMNDIFREVIYYDMHVLPCRFETDGKDLDYRFPLLVGDSKEPYKDVATASDGQAEIINFAFRLVALRQLGIGEYPLMLDELGRPMDEQHRSKLMSYIKMLSDVNMTSQIFLISHYASNHGSLLNASVCALNSTNLTVPDNANEHVVFG